MRSPQWWFWLFLVASLPASESQLPVSLRIKLQNMQQAEAPFSYLSYLIFSVQGDDTVKTVRVAIEDEGGGQLSHPMKRNSYGVFIYWFSLGAEKQVNYRYIVNGLWMRDELNPNYFLNKRGIEVSYVPIARRPRYMRDPVPEDGGQSFYLRAQPGHKIYLVGSFNSWNPFYALMKELEPGLYYYHLELPAGEYFYLFHHDGTFLLDPRNTLRARSLYGMKVSKMRVE